MSEQAPQSNNEPRFNLHDIAGMLEDFISYVEQSNG
jgi:hypothetical protein